MKTITATLNPVLAHVKYLLFTASLILAILIVAQMFFQNFNINIESSLGGSIGQTLLPLLATASISMFLTRRLMGKKEDTPNS
jgi:hypothetical protein